MTRLLLMEGNIADRRARAKSLGMRTSSEIYAEAIRAHFPDIAIDVVNAADPDFAIPEGRDFGDYQGFVVSGSALHAYDTDFAVTNQIDLLKQAAEAGLPCFGSCWGLQIAAMAAGGAVQYHPHGKEVGFARKIMPTEAGEGHAMFRYKPPVFDAPCIHYDEVMRLPEGATLLASNAHSEVQAAIIPLGKSEVWAVQYHPEYDVRQVLAIYRLYAEDMIGPDFFADAVALEAYCAKLQILVDTPSNAGAAWELGVDADILDDKTRRGEIIAWIEDKVLGR
ncbi:MAG: type 1 glutamine amidotransferase [Chakrabartia sp.]